jgi:hypothetical protein
LPLHRVQFIEFHEQPWFPSFLRDDTTDALQFGLNLLRAYAPIVPLLRNLVDSAAERSIVDLCSGGGGPWLELWRTLQKGRPALAIWLTDKYPNLGAFQRVRATSEDHLSFYPGSVDATKVPRELNGVRTLFSSFHHFTPEKARAILQNAVDARQSIGIFEITSRTPSAICLMFPWALMPFVCTPFIRPFRWSRMLWTYLVPIIPLVLLFDGIVSCLRTYRPRELHEIVDNLTAAEYQWEVGQHSEAFGKLPITYLIGYLRKRSPLSAFEISAVA